MCPHVCMWKVVKSSGAAKGVLDKSTLQWHAVINTPRNGPTTKRQRQKIVWNNNRREPLRRLDIKYRINRTKAPNDNNPGPWTCEPFNMTWSHKLAYAKCQMISMNNIKSILDLRPIHGEKGTQFNMTQNRTLSCQGRHFLLISRLWFFQSKPAAVCTLDKLCNASSASKCPTDRDANRYENGNH